MIEPSSSLSGLIAKISRHRTLWTLATLAGVGLAAISGMHSSANVLVMLKMAQGDDGSCAVTADITNRTNNHLNGATITMGDTSLTVPSVSANSRLADIDAFSDGGFPTCEAMAKAIDQMAAHADVTNCSIDNVREGDCQRAFEIRTAFDYGKIRARDRQYAKAVDAKSLKVGSYTLKWGSYVFIELTDDSSDAAYEVPLRETNKVALFGTQDLFSRPYLTREDQIKPIEIVRLHKTARGAVDAYYIRTRGTPVGSYEVKDIAGWIDADELERALKFKPQ